MKSVYVLNQGSEAKMARFCHWLQNYAPPYNKALWNVTDI